VKALILAGGSGERFWPLSTPDTPKQFLKLFGSKTLIRQTFERISPPLDPEDICVVTLERYAQKTLEELPELPKENIIAEPAKKNTAPAIILGTLYIGENETIAVLPADHLIKEKKKFWEVIEKAAAVAQKTQSIVTIGIKPTRPETGYGYIETAEEIEENVYKVKRFREKPDYETAVEFIEKGNFYWNGGMFIFTGKTLLKEAKNHLPQIYEKLSSIDIKNFQKLKKVYEEMEPISIDYAIMEKTENIVMVKANFYWSDVGNWVSVKEIEGYTKESENIALIDSENVFIRGISKKIAVVGLRDVIIVETNEGLLIMSESAAPKVRNAIKKFYSST